MAKKIMQIRYYGDKSDSNYPKKLPSSSLTSGEVFKDYLPMTYLNIQGPEGLKFYLNNGIHPIALGPSGKYELDLNGITEISNLVFDSSTLKSKVTSNNSLIIDIIYID